MRAVWLLWHVMRASIHPRRQAFLASNRTTRRPLVGTEITKDTGIMESLDVSKVMKMAEITYYKNDIRILSVSVSVLHPFHSRVICGGVCVCVCVCVCAFVFLFMCVLCVYKWQYPAKSHYTPNEVEVGKKAFAI